MTLVINSCYKADLLFECLRNPTTLDVTAKKVL